MSNISNVDLHFNNFLECIKDNNKGVQYTEKEIENFKEMFYGGLSISFKLIQFGYKVQLEEQIDKYVKENIKPRYEK